MAIEEKQAEISWEEAVGRFLQDNPGYFERNPHLLQQLEIPHPDTGKAVSLIERQVMSLRRENQALEAQLHQLVDHATENDALAGQLHHFIIELMLATDEAQVARLVTEGLKSRFSLDHVVLKLFSDDPALQDSGHYVSSNSPVVRQISNQVNGGQSVPGISLSEEEAQAFFDQAGAPDGSLALVPVRHEHLAGLLIIGSDDPHRFNSDMATTYLDRIGELVAVALSRLSGR